MSLPRDGIIAALWTPTDAEGRVLETELKTNLDFLRSKGVNGLMVMGSTGEFPQLSLARREGLLELVRTHTGRFPTMANISHIRLRMVAELGQFSRRLGVESVALLAPWFYPLAQEDLAEFFVQSAEAAELPLFLYNFPERTGNRIGLETIAWVAERVPLAGVKQSGAEFDYHRHLAALGREKKFAVLTGGETRLAEAMALGVTGCVSGLANAVPELIVEIYQATRDGAPERASAATERVRRLIDLIRALEFPLDVAAAMAARGLPTGVPKQVVSAATTAKYEHMVRQVRDLYRTWGL